MGTISLFLKHVFVDKKNALKKGYMMRQFNVNVILLHPVVKWDSIFHARYMIGESESISARHPVLVAWNPPKEQPPGNSQVKELFHVSNLESGTAVPTDGDTR